MELKQKQFLAEKRKHAIANDPNVAALDHLILNFRGEAVAWPAIEEDLNRLIESGRLFSIDGLRYRICQPCQCHSNSAWLYWENKSYKLVTGYGLGPDDEIWRPHSWVLDSRSRIIETTVERLMYFGFVLSKSEAEQFFEDNL